MVYIRKISPFPREVGQGNQMSKKHLALKEIIRMENYNWQEITDMLADLEEDVIIKKISVFFSKANTPTQNEISKLLQACQKGMEVVGDRFANGEYFLPDLIFSGEIFKTIMSFISPQSQDDGSTVLGRIVIGTVRGDIHDIGKDIFASLMKVNGFEVYDLGVDVSEVKFLEEVKRVKPQIVAMSGLLASVLEVMKSTVDLLKNSGIQDNLKIIIGGAAVSEIACQYIGADAQTKNAADGVKICKEWLIDG